MKHAYVPKDFRDKARQTIAEADSIINEYSRQGYTLTLRQLYYQFVARGWLPNEQRQYKRLGKLVSDGRLAGLLDWEGIEDRTRNLQDVSTWSSPASIINACVHRYKEDKWKEQPFYIEVWVEKEALAGVMERACTDLDIPFFSCRGYVSQSEMWRAANRLIHKCNNKQGRVLHFGDHDPSGMDMTRDIIDRLWTFYAMAQDNLKVERIALNMDQIERYNPPPDPAKVTDSRYMDYRSKYGENSWELDALPPDVLIRLVRDNVMRYRDEELWADAEAKEEEGRDYLREVEEAYSEGNPN